MGTKGLQKNPGGMMDKQRAVSRRTFVGGLATALTYAGMRPSFELAAAPGQRQASAGFVKISNNENPYGPSEAILEAMTDSFRNANLYMGSDAITEAIANHHGLAPENVILGAGSAEVLKIVDDTFLPGSRNVVGAEPTFETVYRYATNSRAEAVAIPLTADYRHDLGRMARAVGPETGFVYICNPNNPTGTIVTGDELDEFLGRLPEDMVVLVDEAYHHFVEHPGYRTAIPYVKEGRNVIVARTFSKIYGLAGIRLGYGLASKELVERMQAHAQGTISVVAKAAGVAALADPSYEQKMMRLNNDLRERVMADLRGLGYEVIPSECNFFMVAAGRETDPIRKAFEERGVAIGRKFPPMDDYLRISIGTEAQMARFMEVWREVMGRAGSSAAGR